MASKDEKPIIVAFTLDFETGGLKCQTSACTQIAVHATRLDTFERIGSFVRYIAPYNKKAIDGVGEKKKKVLKSKFEEEKAELVASFRQDESEFEKGDIQDLLDPYNANKDAKCLTLYKH